MNIPVEIIQNVKIYCIIYMIGVVSIYWYDISRAFMTALGYSSISFYLVAASLFLNIILDILFICVLGKGVAGASLATILAQMICMCISIKVCLMKIKKLSSTHNHFK